MKFLIIDDSETMRKIQKKHLRELGVAEIFEAENGQVGLEVLTQIGNVDKILLDWNMPVMDGLTFLKTLKNDPKFKNIPVVMCTSESEKRKVIEAMKEGASNYIVKPFTAEILKEKLQL